MSAEDNSEIGDIAVHFDLSDPDGTGGQITLKQPILGLEPYILITGETNGEDVIFNVEGSQTDLEDVENIASVIIQTLQQHRGLEPLELRIRKIIDEAARQAMMIDDEHLEALHKALAAEIDA